MAQIGSVNVTFVANASGLTAGANAAGKAFKVLGGDASALRASLAAIEKIGKQSVEDIGPTADSARAAFQSLAGTAASLREEFASGKIKSDAFKQGMQAVNEEAAATARAMKDAVEITRQNATAVEDYTARLERLNQAIKLGGLEESQATRERQAALESFLAAGRAADRASGYVHDLTGEIEGLSSINVDELFGGVGDGMFEGISRTREEAAALRAGAADAFAQIAVAASDTEAEIQATADAMAQAAAVTKANRTAEEQHADTVKELNALRSEGLISLQTYERAVAASQKSMEYANGTTAAAAEKERLLRDAMSKGLAVTRESMTAKERYTSKVAELRTLLAAGAISQQTYQRATAAAAAQMRSAAVSGDSMSKSVSGITSRMNVLIGLQVARIFSSITASVANGARQLAQFARSEAEAIDSTSKLAGRLGMTYKELTGLKAAGELANVSMDQIGSAATKADVAFVKAAQGSKEANAAFESIGLSVANLQGLNASERFEAIADAIADLPTEAQRSEAAIRLFGRAGAELLPLFNAGSGAIRQATKDADAFGLALTNAQAADVEAMNDSFTRGSQAVRGIVDQVVAYLSPAVTAIVTEFNEFIASAGGANIGQIIGDGVISGARYLAEIGDYLIANLQNIWSYVSNVGEQWNSVVGFQQRVADALSGVFNSGQVIFGGVILGFGTIVERLGTVARSIAGNLGFDTGDLDSFIEGARAFNAEIRAGIDRDIGEAGKAFSDAWNGRAEEGGKAIAGPLVTTLDAALARARSSAAAIDAASKPKAIEPIKIEVSGIKEAIKGVDARSKEGAEAIFRAMRGEGRPDVQQRIAEGIERVARNTEPDEGDFAIQF